MSSQRFALIDPAAGISGDMLLGALIELGASPAWLQGLPARLGVTGVGITIDAVMRCGMQCTKVTVTVNGATEGLATSLMGSQRAGLSARPITTTIRSTRMTPGIITKPATTPTGMWANCSS